MKKLKYIFFTYDGCGLSVAKKLIDEGNTVIVAQIQDVSELKTPGKTEEADRKAKRLSVFDGMIPKHKAKEVLRKMSKIPDKENWFVIFDLNSLWHYAQLAKKMGFKNGFFPTEEDTLFEDDREKGKELVKKFWPDLEVAEVHEFKKVEEGISFLEEHPEDIFVLKANTEGDLTVLASTDDPDLARETLIGALNTDKKEYETAGYILELKITDPIEITPEMVFYNGEPVFTDIDIENKPVGAGSVGNMTGCAGNLIIRTDINDPINDIAFPQKVYDMAAAHQGMFVWDASILIDSRTKKLYFGEFCPNRWGYDAFFTEISMCESASAYFEGIVAGKNPLKKKFGVAVRMMNLKSHEDSTLALKGDEKDIYFYDVKMQDDHMVSVGNDWALVVAAGASNDISEAVQLSYDNLARLSFAGGYYRPQFDFVSTEYQNSIPNRYNFANDWLFQGQKWGEGKKANATSDDTESMKAKHAAQIKRLNKANESKLADLRKEVEAILNDA